MARNSQYIGRNYNLFWRSKWNYSRYYFWEKEIYKRQYFDNKHKECYNRTTQIMSMNDEICLNLKEYLDKLKIISSDQ